ncbi:hypothetical protein E5288_WYG022139 [Bos mutus]|uniref:Heart- and neural crest derivatives-expressed protein 2 n=1 Tax=Bos mutus TaxID=72004 RepID=A0A6B0RKS2_9CETA|nr:hypothetical protein [Bos mutus]
MEKRRDEGTLTDTPSPPQNSTRKRSEEMKPERSQGQPFLPFVSQTDMSLIKRDSTLEMCTRSTTTFLGPLLLAKSHEENPYFHGWLIGHPEMSPPDYSMALSYSPEYASGAASLDHSHYGGVPPGAGPPGLGGPRPVKRRGTANRKERRRTQSINSAFAELRECIPNVPADTKLSKIKTLRLATSYIAYLMDLLAKDDQNGEAEAFKAEIKKTDVKEEKRKKELSSTASAGAPWLRCSPLWKRGQSEAGCLGQHEPPKAPSEPYERFQADKAPDDAGVPVQTGP